MLTTVAFKFVVQQGQPALPYLTMMDVHMLVGFVFLLFLATSVALVHVLVPEEVVDAADGWNFCGAVVVMLSVCTFFVFQAQVAWQAGASKMASQDAAWDGKPTLDQAADLGLQKGVYTEKQIAKVADLYDGKLPWWNGEADTYDDFCLSIQLVADSTSQKKLR